jgi:aspartate ammonia-lyase
MEPVMAYRLFESLKLLREACRILADRCVRGIEAHRDECRRNVERSISLVTALNPYIGYDRATQVADEALATGRTVSDIVLEKGYLTKEELDRVLSPETMINPRQFKGPG